MMAATVASPTRPGQEPLAMNDIITTPDIKDEIKTKRPRLHKVILVNDDYTPREFVVMVLKAEFRMSEDQAGDDHRAQARRVCRCRLYERCSGGQGDERERYGPQIGLPAVVHDGAGGVRHPKATGNTAAANSLGSGRTRMVHPMTRNSSRALRLTVSR